MRKIFAVFMTVLMFSGSCLADTKQEKAGELIKMLDAQGTLSKVYDQLIIPVSCEIIMSDEEEADFKKEFMEIANIQELLQTESQFWVQHYTEEELDQLIAFYKTDLGQKVLKLLPQYAVYSTMEVHKWQERIAPQLVKLSEKIVQKYPRRSGEETQACIRSKMGL